MPRRLLLLLLLFASVCAPARDKTETWIRITSPHFVVLTNSNEKQGRKIADQFERMRSVFHAAFPRARVDPDSPIVVLAVKDERDFRALEPADYLAKGSLKLAGLFLRSQERNYVLLRLDAEGEHPYSVIYHEYTHLLLSKAAEWIPLWVNEGLAEFYQNTDIREKEAMLGQPSSDDILWLRGNRLLPLPTLFTVDAKSPYYHEENKGSIFYAEAWALVHFLEVNDFKQKTHRVTDYLNLLAQNADPVAAATQTFGDLKVLQSSLDHYVHQGTFQYFKMTTTTDVDDSAFRAQILTGAQSDAVRADFLACNQRTADAQALLDHVLQEDPNNVAARETKGLIEFQQGHLDEARKWYMQAVQLDSQSYLAHYYFAVISMQGGGASEDPQVEASLRAAVKLNPNFAPAFALLATYLGMQRKNLDEARITELTAVSLDPSNVRYRANMANIYMMQGNTQSALDVLRAAQKIAKTPADAQLIDNFMMRAQEYAAKQEAVAARTNKNAPDEDGNDEAEVVSTRTNTVIPSLKHREFVAKGPHRFLQGVLNDVHCDYLSINLTLVSKAKNLKLQAESYYKIRFTSLGFQPSADLNPCHDLENRPAKVEYVESENPADPPQLIAVELHK